MHGSWDPWALQVSSFNIVLNMLLRAEVAFYMLRARMETENETVFLHAAVTAFHTGGSLTALDFFVSCEFSHDKMKNKPCAYLQLPPQLP